MVTATGVSQTFRFDTSLGGIHLPTQLELAIVEGDLVRAPTSITVTVDGADPSATMTFALDGDDIWTDDADVDGSYIQNSIPIPANYPTSGDPVEGGLHTLTVTTPNNGTASSDFTLAQDPDPDPLEQSADTPPTFADGSTGRWVFQDPFPGGLGSWILPIGPSAMSVPHIDKQAQVVHTTAVNDGRYEVAIPRLATKPWQLSGYVPDEAFYDQLLAYAALQRRFYAIDHRGRAWVVVAQELTIQPRKRHLDDDGNNVDWAGDWNFSLVILDQYPTVVEDD